MNTIKSKKLLWIIVIFVAGFFLLLLIRKPASSTPSDTSQTELKAALAHVDLNKEFTFPLKDKNGKEVSKIKLFIQNAELRDEIIYRGQKATAAPGKHFLILDLKITNEYDQTIELDTRNYLRFAVAGVEGELLAPEIHNDPVEVQAISTKYTRVGLPVDEANKQFILNVGEIKGDKQKVDISF